MAFPEGASIPTPLLGDKWAGDNPEEHAADVKAEERKIELAREKLQKGMPVTIGELVVRTQRQILNEQDRLIREEM